MAIWSPGFRARGLRTSQVSCHLVDNAAVVVAAEHLPDARRLLRLDGSREETFLGPAQPDESILQAFVGDLLLLHCMNEGFEGCGLDIDVAAADEKAVAAD